MTKSLEDKIRDLKENYDVNQFLMRIAHFVVKTGKRGWTHEEYWGFVEHSTIEHSTIIVSQYFKHIPRLGEVMVEKRKEACHDISSHRVFSTSYYFLKGPTYSGGSGGMYNVPENLSLICGIYHHIESGKRAQRSYKKRAK